MAGKAGRISATCNPPNSPRRRAPASFPMRRDRGHQDWSFQRQRWPQNFVEKLLSRRKLNSNERKKNATSEDRTRGPPAGNATTRRTYQDADRPHSFQNIANGTNQVRKFSAPTLAAKFCRKAAKTAETKLNQKKKENATDGARTRDLSGGNDTICQTHQDAGRMHFFQSIAAGDIQARKFVATEANQARKFSAPTLAAKFCPKSVSQQKLNYSEGKMKTPPAGIELEAFRVETLPFDEFTKTQSA